MFVPVVYITRSFLFKVLVENPRYVTRRYILWTKDSDTIILRGKNMEPVHTTVNVALLSYTNSLSQYKINKDSCVKKMSFSLLVTFSLLVLISVHLCWHETQGESLSTMWCVCLLPSVFFVPSNAAQLNRSHTHSRHGCFLHVCERQRERERGVECAAEREG